MGLFGDMMSKVFHHGVAERPPDAAPDSGPIRHARPDGSAPAPAAPAAAPVAAPAPAATPAPAAPVDVAAILDGLAAKRPQKLNWRQSIVDMMTLLGMDSSLAARRELAADLEYTGDTKDTYTMNVWLHKQVMKKLAENGGKVPPELL